MKNVNSFIHFSISALLAACGGGATEENNDSATNETGTEETKTISNWSNPMHHMLKFLNKQSLF